MPSRCALDTNILLRLFQQDDPHYFVVQLGMRRLASRQVEFVLLRRIWASSGG
jgi:hypothetical protein